MIKLTQRDWFAHTKYRRKYILAKTQGLLPTQISNPHFLHRQAGSLPLSHPGNQRPGIVLQNSIASQWTKKQSWGRKQRDSDSESPKQGLILFRAFRLTLRFHRCTFSLGKLSPSSPSNWLLLRMSTPHIVPSTLSFHTAPHETPLTRSLFPFCWRHTHINYNLTTTSLHLLLLTWNLYQHLPH